MNTYSMCINKIMTEPGLLYHQFRQMIKVRKEGMFMRNTIKKIYSFLLAVIFILLSAQPVNVNACHLPPSEWRCSPKVLTGEVTENYDVCPCVCVQRHDIVHQK